MDLIPNPDIHDIKTRITKLEDNDRDLLNAIAGARLADRDLFATKNEVTTALTALTDTLTSLEEKLTMRTGWLLTLLAGFLITETGALISLVAGKH